MISYNIYTIYNKSTIKAKSSIFRVEGRFFHISICRGRMVTYPWTEEATVDCNKQQMHIRWDVTSYNRRHKQKKATGTSTSAQ